MHPILFRIGPFSIGNYRIGIGPLPIGTYGIAIVVGMLSALWLCGRLARRRGLPVDFFYDLIFRMLLWGFGGARGLYIMLNWNEFTQDPLGLLLSRQGFVFQGGFIAALVAGAIFTRKRGLPLLSVTDVVAPALALAHGFGRIGCFFAGCCYGKICEPGHMNALERLLSVRYPLDLEPGGQLSGFNFAYQAQLARGLITPDATAPLPILPVQLFESFGNFLICVLLLWTWRRQRFSGQVFALYMMIYSVLRFSLEFLRGDIDRGVFFHGLLSTGQLIAIATFAGGVALWWLRRGKGMEPIPALVTEAAPEPAPKPATAKASRKRK